MPPGNNRLEKAVKNFKVKQNYQVSLKKPINLMPNYDPLMTRALKEIFP